MKFKNEEEIKEKIMDGCKRGVCDSEGNSIADQNGRAKAPPKRRKATEVLRNGKWIKVI